MKHVFVIEGKEPQVHVDYHEWSGGTVDGMPKWNGGRVEVLIVDCINWGDDATRREGDALYVECDADALRRLLRDLTRLLEANEHFARERVEKMIARTVLCSRCKTYADPLNEWHGDGHGKACYGLAENRLELVRKQTVEAQSKQVIEDERKI